MTTKNYIPFAVPEIDDDEITEVIQAMRSGWLTMGPRTLQFEEQLAAYTGSAFAVSVNSCTAGLHLALVAIGIGPGDEVITTPFTFCATSNVIEHTGAKPIFVDIDPETYNIDPSKIEQQITEHTKAIMPVHYAGHPCDMKPIHEIAQRYNLAVIEDAAHALGAQYDGKSVGSISDMTVFSFYANKNLTTGEGGAITTNNEVLAEKLRLLRLHGMSRDAWKRYSKAGSWQYDVVHAGYKYNMTDIDSAIGLKQLGKYGKMQEQRRRIVSLYNEQLRGIDGLQTPIERINCFSANHLYTILVDPKRFRLNRDELIQTLTEENIGTSVHFIPMYKHTYYKNKYNLEANSFPVTENVFQSILSLPLYPRLEDSEVIRVAETVKKLLGVE